jgi:hypothetical protein
MNNPRLIGSKTAKSMKTKGRDKQSGRFLKGNGGGPGRPAIAKEQAYTQSLAETCSIDDWRAICSRAVEDAKNGDHRAREWLGKYLVGEPASVRLHAHLHADTSENPFLNAPADAIIEAKVAMSRLEEASRCIADD